MRTPRLASLELPVLLPALALLVTGVIAIWSTSKGRDPMLWKKQVLFAVAGVGVAGTIVLLGTRSLLGSSWEIYAAGLLVLGVMPFVADPGQAGAARWIRLPLGFKLQPSEFMKIALVLGLARYLRHRGLTNTWRSYAGPFALLALPWFLVMSQPDLGTSLVLVPVTLAMVTVSGARLRHVGLLVAASVALLLAAFWLDLMPGYQVRRIKTYKTSVPTLVAEARAQREARDHEAAQLTEKRIQEFRRDEGHQHYFGLVALGSGGLAGAGLGQGLLTSQDRVPVSESDFIFAVVGEELGLLGTLWVLLLHAALLAAILGVAHRTREPFGRLVCVGVGALLAGQALMNMGIVTGLLPVTGLTLPLVSYGGSSVVASCAALGCVLAVAGQREAVFFEQ